MKRIVFFTQLTTVVLAAALLFTGCKKENSDTLSAQEEEQAATFSSESETQTEATFDDVFNNVLGVNDDVGTGGTGIFGRAASSQNGRTSSVDSVPSCVTVTIIPQQAGLYPKTITIDFGSGCLSHNHLRSGKIKIVYTGRLITAGSSATTTFDNYKIDSVLVEGTHKITNTTATTAGSNQRQFTIDVTDAKLTKPNGSYSQWNAHRVNTQIEGNGTVGPGDDIFKVTGSARGKVKREDHIYLWDSEITEPIIKKFSCNWISKGRVRVVRVGLAANSPWVATLDYGTGTCDDQATVTINGVVRQITLR